MSVRLIRRRAARALLAAALFTAPSGVAAQAGNAPQFGDPPPPVGPSMINQAGEGGATLRAVRVSEPLRIDGVIDEAFYLNTQPITEFVQSLPIEGGEPSQLTEVWIGFDDDNVYVSAKVWDTAGPDGWIANEMRRDSEQIRQNDNFGVFLDTYYDRRTAVAFYGNAIGGVSDFQINSGGGVNRDWNPVRQSKTALFDGGWSIEFAIPFKSLRYRPGREQIWGIQLRRAIMRENEWDYIRALPLSVVRGGPSGANRVSMYGTLVGIEAPPPSRNLELKPFGISGVQTDLTSDPQRSNDGYADAGLDIKYGITENLTADFTYNTDFAQVEVDEQQVNLTRFSLFFPEKREFFLESQGIFEFGSGGIGGGGGGGGARGGGGGGGGGAPTLFYSRQIGLQSGVAVPILGGGRVTGKVGSFDVGLVNIQTDDAQSVGAESTNFSVVRVNRSLFARSRVGVLLENRSKSVVSSGSNQAWGVDGFFGFTEELDVLAYYAETRTEGLTGLDASYRGQFSYHGDQWGATAGHLVVGNDFNPEIGSVRRKDFRQTTLSGRFSPRTASISWVRQLTFQADFGYLENERVGFLESRNWGGQFRAEFENSDQFSINYTNNFERLVEDTRISGATIPTGRYSFPDVRVSYTLGTQRSYAGTLSVRKGQYYGGDLTSIGINRSRVEISPQISFEPSISFNWIDLPQGQFDQHVAATEVTYTITPRAYLSGLLQYNSGSDSFGGNFRFRWEWAPGSELFLVFTEERDTDVLDRWPELRNRGFVIKVNRLLRI
ncbi:MAG: DUF5916 domain-containing protein [Gemmatimonadetes bacterium]|nr:DUF5916 domain-containing protein [Gemmatimonadota bacterium]MDA1104656.1 DUF5916 domain-containing protein [Gemmatimonadota bacterium]